MQIIKYIDPAQKEIIKEIEALETTIVNLTSEKSDIEQLIYAFNTAYTKAIGKTLKAYLEQKEKHIEQQLKSTSDEPTKQKLQEDLKTTQKQKTEYSTQIPQKSPPLPTLSPQQSQELKKLYRKACRLCHPDMVDEPFRQEAIELFHKLNEAHQKKDIAKVREILDYLEHHQRLNTKTLSDLETLKKKKSELTTQTMTLEIEINDLKADTTYKKIKAIDDWERYFNTTRKQLEQEIHKHK